MALHRVNKESLGVKMRLAVPLTGTVIREGSVFGNGLLKGSPDDPIRLIDINLGHVSWTMVDVDTENEVMVIEVSPEETVSEDTGEVDHNGDNIFSIRQATKEEKEGFLLYARQLVEGKTKTELYEISKSPKLKRPLDSQ